MDCYYSESLNLGWYLIGLSTGWMYYNIISDLFPYCSIHKRRPPVIHYIPIYIENTHVDTSDNEMYPNDDSDAESDVESDAESDAESDVESDAESDVESDAGSIIENVICNDSRTIQKGDRVMVTLKDGQEEPSFGWGGVHKDDVGIVVSSYSESSKGTLCYRVDFPNHLHWLAQECELRRI